MSTTTTPKPTKLCPTCGTQLAENATRCLVCGNEFTGEKRQPKSIQGSRMPEIRLSLPLALGLLIIILAIGAGVVYLGLNAGNRIINPTPIPTITTTPTMTPTATETPIPTLTLTPTPLPPLEYFVKSGDYCISLALAFNVSQQSIILLNNLRADCTDLVVGQKLLIPQPTPTPLPVATGTLVAADATRSACQTVIITVQLTDTLSSISLNYGVSMDAIKEWNGLSTDNVYLNQPLTVPLCMRNATSGPSPTPTLPPPYPAPNLLLPANGAPFNLANDIVSLQWASIGTLRNNEAYLVTVEDVTEGLGRKLNEYVTDTKYIVPVSFRPQDNQPHAMSWQVVTVRQTGTDDQGNSIWSQAGTTSQLRIFIWSGAAPVPSPTPQK
jgi:LysM repeat protein